MTSVALGLTDNKPRQQKPDQRERDTQVERLRAQPVYRCDVTGRERGERHRPVAGKFIQAHCEPAPLGPCEVNLHDDGGRPSETLAHAQEHVGDQDPVPRRRPHENERDRNRDEPAAHQNGLPTHGVREATGEIVGDRLYDAA